MSQHDMDLANQAGAAFRADVNNALGALVTCSSGASAPATTYGYMFWADITTGLLKQRNGSNSAWITLGNINTIYLGLLDGSKAAVFTTLAATSFSVGSLIATELIRGQVNFSIADDNVYSFTPADDAGLLFFYDAVLVGIEGVAIVHYKTGASPGTYLLVGSSVARVGTGVHTGTTGTDTCFTIATHTDGKIYIENRRGIAITVGYLIMAG